jgi:hypothetical protein
MTTLPGRDNSTELLKLAMQFTIPLQIPDKSLLESLGAEWADLVLSQFETKLTEHRDLNQLTVPGLQSIRIS